MHIPRFGGSFLAALVKIRRSVGVKGLLFSVAGVALPDFGGGLLIGICLFACG